MKICFSINSLWNFVFLFLTLTVSPVFAGHSHHEGMDMRDHSSHQTPPAPATPAPSVKKEAVINNSQETQAPQPKPKPNELLLSDETSRPTYEELPEQLPVTAHKKHIKSKTQTQTSASKKKSVQEMVLDYYTDTKK